MLGNKNKSDGIILPIEEELKFKPAVGFENTMDKVMQMVVGSEITERHASPDEPDCDMLRKIVD